MPDLHILPTPEEMAREAAKLVVNLAAERVQAQGRFTIALAGGSTPRLLYRTLASSPFAEDAPWDCWHLFWGDERCVPPDHPDSNYRMAREALLDSVPIPEDQVHRIRGELPPATAAEQYESLLRRQFDKDLPAFDLVLLGVGEDGHTASLFPGTDALENEQQLVTANWVPHLQVHRVTFTLLLINAAATVVFLATDGSKSEAIGRILNPSPGSSPLPAGRVRPASGVAHWFLTTAAASQLTGVKA